MLETYFFTTTNLIAADLLQIPARPMIITHHTSGKLKGSTAADKEVLDNVKN